MNAGYCELGPMFLRRVRSLLSGDGVRKKVEPSMDFWHLHTVQVCPWETGASEAVELQGVSHTFFPPRFFLLHAPSFKIRCLLSGLHRCVMNDLTALFSQTPQIAFHMEKHSRFDFGFLIFPKWLYQAIYFPDLFLFFSHIFRNVLIKQSTFCIPYALNYIRK